MKTDDPIKKAQEVMKLIPHRYPFLHLDRIFSFNFETLSVQASKLGSTFIKFSSEASSIISNSNAGLFFSKFIPSW